jgi:acetyl esterase/lipase
MKTIISIIICFFFTGIVSAQRYLNPVFTNVNVYSNITYGAAINIQSQVQTLVLDFYEPNGDTILNRPLLIYIHGGGFSDTNQTKSLPHIVAFCDSFARRGYAVASINYRLDSVNTGLSNRAIINAMHDAKAAIRFFKTYATLFKVDSNIIFIGGESAGAITAMNAAYINQANEVLYPLTPPLNADLSIEGNSGSPTATSKVKGVLCFCGGTKHVSTLPVFDTNAINLATDPYILFTHGTADPLLPVQYSLEIALRASHLGLPHLYYPFYGATHCPWGIGLPNSWAYLDSLVNYTSPFLYFGVLNSKISANSNKKESHFKVFPNPANTYLEILLPNGFKEEKMEILNTYTGVVLSQKLFKSKTHIDISNLPNGIYFIQLRSSPNAIQRFIKSSN